MPRGHHDSVGRARVHATAWRTRAFQSLVSFRRADGCRPGWAHHRRSRSETNEDGAAPAVHCHDRNSVSVTGGLDVQTSLGELRPDFEVRSAGNSTAGSGRGPGPRRVTAGTRHTAAASRPGGAGRGRRPPGDAADTHRSDLGSGAPGRGRAGAVRPRRPFASARAAGRGVLAGHEVTGGRQAWVRRRSLGRCPGAPRPRPVIGASTASVWRPGGAW